jgi:hypothetical protein
MGLDTPARGSIAGEHQKAGHARRIPAAIARHVSAKASLPVQASEHALNVRDDRFDLDD